MTDSEIFSQREVDTSTMIDCRLSRIVFLSLIFAWVWPSTLQAGVFLTLGPNWNNFVFEPEAKESTPNYFGYGGRISWGYSIGQVLDLGVYSQYAPGKLKVASALDGDAALLDYGGELGIRILNLLFIGGRGGVWRYQLYKKTMDDEISGKWMGLGGAASMGMIMPVTKRSAWQVSLDVGQANMRKIDNTPEDFGTNFRKLSKVSITLAFVYNDDDSTSVTANLLNSFLNTFF